MDLLKTEENICVAFSQQGLALQIIRQPKLGSGVCNKAKELKFS